MTVEEWNVGCRMLCGILVALVITVQTDSVAAAFACMWVFLRIGRVFDVRKDS